MSERAHCYKHPTRYVDEMGNCRECTLLALADALAEAVELAIRDPLQQWVCLCPTSEPICALCVVTAAARAYRAARQP